MYTGKFGDPVTGVVKQIGSDEGIHGLGFSQSGSSFGVYKRDKGVETFVSQSAWNLDTFDGNGASGKTLNTAFAQIYVIDYEWLGVGRVRFGCVQNGEITYVHQLGHLNELTQPYISNPNLPIRYSITNHGSATTASLRQICSTVASEGGTAPYVSRTIDNNSTGLSIGNNEYVAVIAIRPRDIIEGNYHSGRVATVTPGSIGVFSISNTNFYWSLLLNPDMGGSLTYQSDRTGSLVEYSLGAATNTITAGTGKLLASGFGAGGQVLSFPDLGTATHLTIDINDVKDVLVLAIRNFGNSSTYYGSLSWRRKI
jgi:hypothetical protein